VPLTVVSGGRGGPAERRRRPAHRARAQAAPRGRHVPAEASGHPVPLTEREPVVAEVVRVVEDVPSGVTRGGGQSSGSSPARRTSSGGSGAGSLQWSRKTVPIAGKSPRSPQLSGAHIPERISDFAHWK
jgi:hypothetical protein